MLQTIQILENFVSMAIQGTQIPMYTEHTLFLYFSNFSLFILKNKQNKNCLAHKENPTFIESTLIHDVIHVSSL